MRKNVLITGGAGFIGSHLADQLIEAGASVRVLDNLSPQVHPEGAPPEYLHPEVDLRVGDVRDEKVLRESLDGIDAVVHLAAAVGVGQSMYEIGRYTSVNNLGTAVLLEALAEHPVERLVVASSMSIYGEGAYVDQRGRPQEVSSRPLSRLLAGQWEVAAEDGSPLQPVPTSEKKTPEASSVYALSKYDQERLCLLVGQAYGIPTVALRLFNVYGPRQALSNPYTGVMAIFASRYLNGASPLVFEDGRQRRDFVNVRDVARAFRLALEAEQAPGEVFNIGSGRSVTVREIAEEMATALQREDIEPEITGEYRSGDIRHCFADIDKARRLLGYEPQVEFADGLMELVQWLRGQTAVDRSEDASGALRQKGLLV